jgi:hypothetical protein
MPFGGYFDTYFESIYRPAILAAGLHPRRADDLFRPSAIVSDIWQETRKAKVLLADLSERNANVFYELGLAHAIGKPVILVTSSMDFVPFDLRSLRVLAYDKNRHDWGADLKAGITNAIKETLAEPLKAIPSTFIATDAAAVTTHATEDEKRVAEVREELNRLREEFNRMVSLLMSTPIGQQSLFTPTYTSLLGPFRNPGLQRCYEEASRRIEAGDSSAMVYHNLTTQQHLTPSEATMVITAAIERSKTGGNQ